MKRIERADQPGISPHPCVVLDHSVKPTAGQVVVVVHLSLVHARQVRGIGELPGQPNSGRTNGIRRSELQMVKGRFHADSRVRLPAHRYAQCLQSQPDRLVDKASPVVPRHPFLRGNELGVDTLGHEQLAQPGPNRDFVIKLLLGHVHHRKENECQRRRAVG
jgi:hypothetical protein